MKTINLLSVVDSEWRDECIVFEIICFYFWMSLYTISSGNNISILIFFGASAFSGGKMNLVNNSSYLNLIKIFVFDLNL